MSFQCECGHKHGTGRIEKRSDEVIQQYLVPVEYRKPTSWFDWPLYYLRSRYTPMIAPCMTDIGDMEWQETKKGWQVKMRCLSVGGVDSIENFETLKTLYMEDRANLSDEQIKSYFETPYVDEITDPYAKKLAVVASITFLFCLLAGYKDVAFHIGVWSLLAGGIYMFFSAVAKRTILYLPISVLLLAGAKHLSTVIF
jgi:predicted PolB exonuclease-like 3'-5' exonuclease